MFEHVKQNVGKWTRQEEDATPAARPVEDSEPVRGRAARTAAAHGPAVIGPSIRIHGELTGEEDLVIEGQVDGTIHLEKHNLTIGGNGRVKANIQANGVIVEGQLEGDIAGTEKVIIRRTGNMRGNIVAPRVTLEDGAMFKGSIEMEPETRRAGEPVVASLSKSAPVAATPATDKQDKRAQS
ncbi:MAG: polymer-forming cytoskeletal protein [Gammaproteobacteria bacterium]